MKNSRISSAKDCQEVYRPLSGHLDISKDKERKLDMFGLEILDISVMLDSQAVEPTDDTACFYPNDETGYLIPRDPNLYGPNSGDHRMTWFCFSNQDEAKVMLGITDDIETHLGTATIQVSEYVVDRAESEVWDTAQLDAVHKIE